MIKSSPYASLPPLVPAATPTASSISDLLQELMPGGLQVPLTGEWKEAVAITKNHIATGQPLLYNAVFAFNGIATIVDILEMQQGHYHAFIFRPSTRAKETHLVDAALNDYVVRKAGLQLNEISLLLLNSAYVREGPLSPQRLFIEERVSKRLEPHYPAIHGRIAMVKRIAAQKAKRENRNSQEIRSGNGPLESSGPSGFVQSAELVAEPQPLAAFLASLQYPLYFMDFEAYQTALPEYDGHWPFRQIPFQFSIHCQDEPEGELQHEGFIVPPGIEPTAAFGAALLKAMGEKGTVLVYNLDSERLILNQLASGHPQLAAPIAALRERLVDLMTPFSKGYIRIPSIGNKLSLKYILPALVPDMSYAMLEIGDGKDVNEAYNAIRHSNDIHLIESTRTALLAYCKVDTLAMVRILEKMRSLVRQ
jgi:hypothetical protein